MPDEITTETPEIETAEHVPEDATEGTESSEGTDALGDAGKKALDSMKSKWHTERDKRRTLESELEKLRSSSTGDGETPDVDAVRAEAAREATAKANARILRSEVKAAAAGKLTDTADALKFLDLSAFEVDENGDVDSSEITDAIEELITNKPYLAATAKRFQGTADGGARKASSGPSQLTRADLAGMKPEQIAQAKKEGRLKSLLSGDN